MEVAWRRSGKQFDPGLVDAFADNAAELLDGLDETSNWDAIISAEPSLATWLTNDEFNAVIEAMGVFTDLKSPYTIGHSRSVAELARGAAIRYGLSEADAATIRQAAMLHDIARLGVPNSIWDKKGPLTHSEMERVRLHPYFTERMLAFSPALAPLGAIAVQNHECLDGSGYPRGLSGEAITPAGRILAATDVYHALLELRPHRPARRAEDAAAILRSEVTAGRLEGAAVNAVLHTAGHKVRGHREWPGGLTSREVEVLRLVARGLSNKEIAGALFISPKTAGNHIEHIYTRIGVSSRATASLYAMQHGLLADGYEV